MKILSFLSYLILCIPFLSAGQLCNGNLGDPIVNITFGTRHTPLPQAATSFSYVDHCPSDAGSYTIQNLIFGCGEAEGADPYHPVIGDHTRDLNGQYMLVNASWTLAGTPSVGLIHLDTATGLCANTTYQYSAWLANVMRSYTCNSNPQLPNITFTVSSLAGKILATANSGSLPVEDGVIFKQYGLSFVTQPDVDAVVLTLSIDAKRGCGNLFVVDDITFSACGPGVTATIDGKTEPANVCADYTNPFILNGAYTSGFNDPVVQWQSSSDSGLSWFDITGATNLSYVIPHRRIGDALYRMAVAERSNINSLHCRVVSNTIYTKIFPLPEHHAPQTLIGCISKDLQLPNSDPSALSNTWSGPNGYSSNDPKAIVHNVSMADTGIYQLQQNFYFGCTSVDTFNLKVFPSVTVSTQTLYSICEGNTINLSASGQGSFKWTPATALSNDTISNPMASPHDSIIYKVLLTNSFGCKDSAEITINVFKNPQVSAGPDKTIVTGDTVLLNGSVKGTAVTYLWNPTTFMDDPSVVTPKVYPQQNTEYTIRAVSNVGCGDVTSKASVKVFKDIFIPNAFTPNYDGINDQFKIFAADGYVFTRLLIYDRWGKLVFSAKDAGDEWNGTANNEPQPQGTYVYYLEFKKSSGKKIIRKGIVSLLR